MEEATSADLDGPLKPISRSSTYLRLALIGPKSMKAGMGVMHVERCGGVCCTRGSYWTAFNDYTKIPWAMTHSYYVLGLFRIKDSIA